MTIYLSKFRVATRALLFVAGVILWSAEAKAQTVPAASGLSNTAAGTACFSEYYGGETNTCASWQYWVVPLVAPVAASPIYMPVKVRVNTSNITTTPIECYAYSMDVGANSLYQTSTVAATATGASTLSLGDVYLPNDSPNTYFAQVVCAAWPNTSVYGVTYNF
jgi:hypothetical protein